MAEQEVWMGSVGPFLFDDDEEYDEELEPGVTFKGVRTTHTVEAKDLEGNLQGYNEGLKSRFLL